MSHLGSHRVPRLKAFCLLIGLVICGKRAPAQTDQDVTIRATTRIVEISVVATGKGGQPIPDLQQSEIELYDGGRSEKISVFSAEARARTANQGEADDSDVFSNRRDAHAGSSSSINIVLLDALNTRFEDQVYAKAQTIKFLQQIQPDDRVALYALRHDIRVLHDFTRDARPLLEALGRFQSTPTSPSVSDVSQSGLASQTALFNDFNSVFERSQQSAMTFLTRDRVMKTLSALEAIAMHAGHFSGRKNLIWVSGGFPFWFGPEPGAGREMPRMGRPGGQASAQPPQTFFLTNFSSEVARTARAFSDANIAIYPVDASGLVAWGPSATRLESSRGGTILDDLASMSNDILSDRDSMVILAERTGGRAFYNTNDITAAIRKAVDDTRVTYLVGYYPTHGKWDGKFREIKLKSKRRGIDFRHRRGYFAMPDKIPDDNQRRLMVQAAILSPLDATAVGLEAKVERNREPGSASLGVDVTIDPRSIIFVKKGGIWSGKIEIAVAQPTPEGTVGTGEAKTVELSLRQESYDRMMQDGLKFRQTAEIMPSANHLRVVIYDWSSGTIGSVTIPLARYKSAESPP